MNTNEKKIIKDFFETEINLSNDAIQYCNLTKNENMLKHWKDYKIVIEDIRSNLFKKISIEN